MKYIKIYERINSYDILDSVAYYLEEIIPVSKDEGFKECEYDDSKPPIFSFYFKDWTDEETYDKFYKFLENNGLTIYDEKVSKYEIEIFVKIPRNKIIEYAEIYDTTKKYNL